MHSVLKPNHLIDALGILILPAINEGIDTDEEGKSMKKANYMLELCSTKCNIGFLFK
jgi:hypothetical protein